VKSLLELRTGDFEVPDEIEDAQIFEYNTVHIGEDPLKVRKHFMSGLNVARPSRRVIIED
jgi:hypothetical protein